MSISVILNGQTFIDEDFGGGVMPPDGWTIDGHESQWSISSTANAGGTSPEATFRYVNTISITRFISPSIDLSGFTSLVLSFKHFLDDYSGTGYTLGVATRANEGDWNTVWSVNPTGDLGPEEILLAIENDDVGSSDFQFCVYLEGNFYNLDNYYLDDILLSAMLNIDCKMNQISTPSFLNGPVEVTGSVKNVGINVINSINLSWQANEGEIYSSYFDGLVLNFNETFEFTFDDLFDYPIGAYDLKVWITEVNGSVDDNPDNDSMNKLVSVVSNVVHRRPCIEEFTSSTCGPCATLNSQFVPWCNTHEDEISLLKYQVNWPGSGDPYYTEEVGVRVSYYGVSGVPALFFNGSYKGYAFSGVQPAFEEAMAMPGLMSLVSSHAFNGTEITVNATILPYAGFQNAKVHIAVFEYITTGNTGNNGETQFEHVMMKMIPGSEGTSAVFTDRTPFIIDQTIDLSGTNVEEWDDLGVIVFVQDNNNQEIHQSDYSVENGVFATDASLLELSVDGVPIEDFDPSIFEYFIELPEGTTEIPLVEGTSTDANAIVMVEPANELPGSTYVDVFAEDLITNNRYTVTFTIATGLNDLNDQQIKLYPNPTSGILNISSDKNASICVYATDGSLIGEYQLFNNKQIDLSHLSNGIYFVKVLTENQIVTKKISLNR